VIYTHPLFTKFLDRNNVSTIVEAGARWGAESRDLSEFYRQADIYSFEPNPNTREDCRNELESLSNVKFYDFGLGDKNDELPFFSTPTGHEGSSSFLKRIDFESFQEQTGVIKTLRLDDFMRNEGIQHIDLLCMDVQGFELNILKGAGEFIDKIKFVIMEEPTSEKWPAFLPQDIHSFYVGAPPASEIQRFMIDNGFQEIARIRENDVEDNVMYGRIK
jgi:FkbM family methyltransferase|tara:strand:+ start:1881 stop:2534 length:654 start_codon:yes stop_codon:yes gene_type:complete